MILPPLDAPALPVPANSPDPPSKHPTLGIPAATLKALRARPCDASGVEVLLRSAIGEDKRSGRRREGGEEKKNKRGKKTLEEGVDDVGMLLLKPARKRAV